MTWNIMFSLEVIPDFIYINGMSSSKAEIQAGVQHSPELSGVLCEFLDLELHIANKN
jgi:hypothetical protein